MRAIEYAPLIPDNLLEAIEHAIVRFLAYCALCLQLAIHSESARGDANLSGRETENRGTVDLHSCLDDIQWVPGLTHGLILEFFIFYFFLGKRCSVHDKDLQLGSTNKLPLTRCQWTYFRDSSHRTRSKLIAEGEGFLLIRGHGGLCERTKSLRNQGREKTTTTKKKRKKRETQREKPQVAAENADREVWRRAREKKRSRVRFSAMLDIRNADASSADAGNRSGAYRQCVSGRP